MNHCICFRDDETGYLNWLGGHAQGYVVNTPRVINASYFVLHKAKCYTIRPGRSYVHGAFTERSYSKVVADDLNELRAFMTEHGIADFSLRCSKCDA